MSKKIVVKSFIVEMQKKLSVNSHKGDRKGWLTDDKWTLYGRLIDETYELRRALEDYKAKDIIQECADVANFAMMIADKTMTEERKRKRDK